MAAAAEAEREAKAERRRLKEEGLLDSTDEEDEVEESDDEFVATLSKQPDRRQPSKRPAAVEASKEEAT